MKTNIRKILSLLLVIAMLLFTAVSFTGSAEPVTDEDKDGDGLTEAEELELGTNASNPDTDGDGIIDSVDEKPLEKANEVKELSEDEADREDVSSSLMNIFLFVLLLSFAIFSLLAGIFTAYFGAGKSRAIGGGLLVLGLIIILVWVYYGILGSYPDDTLLGVVHWNAAKTLEAFITVLSAIIGAVIAVVMFLVAIMKS